MALCLATSIAQAGDYDWTDSLVSDRPDVAEASRTVGKLRLQIETSFEFAQDIENNITTRLYGFPTLVRFGIIDPIEIRVNSPIYLFRTRSDTRYDKGPADFTFGLKWNFLDYGPKGIPSMAVVVSCLFPTGADQFSENAYVPAFKIIADWKLPVNLSLGVNLGVNVPGRDDAGDRYAQFLYATSLGYVFHGTQDRLKMYIEVVGISPIKSNKPDIRFLGTGLMFLITPDVQVDGFMRAGITKHSPDWVAGLGGAFRFF
jgi:hypothetical protein